MSAMFLNPASCLSSLGFRVGDSYKPSDNCLHMLKEIHQNLLSEDKVTLNFRRAIHFSHGFENDLIPLLLESNDDEILDELVKILACLLVPIECLLPVELVSQMKNGQITLFELKTFLGECKTAFRDQKISAAILEVIRSIIAKNNGKPFSQEACETINNCIIIFRNVLHIADCSKNLHNIILHNLFAQNIADILLELMIHERKEFWSVATVQLLAVMYKDQHVGTLQKLLQAWFEASQSESSEDESNTTQDPRSTSSLMVTSSEPTSSDSSEVDAAMVTKETTHEAGCFPAAFLHREVAPESTEIMTNKEEQITADPPCPLDGDPEENAEKKSRCNKSPELMKRNTSSKKVAQQTAHEISDYGYSSSPMLTTEAISTSSNEDEPVPHKRPFYVKHHATKTRFIAKQQSPHKKKEAKRRSILKRRKYSAQSKVLLANYIPRDEDVTKILAEFTVEFLMAGYKNLVPSLLNQLLAPISSMPLDASHFFWLLTYFMKFTGQLELDLAQVSGVLSFNVLAYLVYESVSITEEVEQTLYLDVDVKSSLRRQHLVVTAIREFLLSLQAYDKVTFLSSEDKQQVHLLKEVVASCSDLKTLFVLMLRSFRQDVHSRQYLEDLIITNHILLIFLDQQPQAGQSSISSHLKQFATTEIMKNYGIVLEDFQSNGEFLNDCIFTMMHHVAGEVNQLPCLYQPCILRTFTRIWESDVQLCEDWTDLIEYTMHEFVSSSKNEGNGNPENGSAENKKDTTAMVQADNSKSPSGLPATTDERQLYIGAIVRNGYEDELKWLLQYILSIRTAKLLAADAAPDGELVTIPPVSFYNAKKNLPIPIVPWTAKLAQALSSNAFRYLLIAIGFHPPLGKLYFRVPGFWTADDLLQCARHLGAVDSELKALPSANRNCPMSAAPSDLPFTMACAKKTASLVNATPVPNIPTNWLHGKRHHTRYSTTNDDIDVKPEDAIGIGLPSCVTTFKDEVDEMECASIVSICNSHTSDVTRLCISDDECDASAAGRSFSALS